MGRVVVVGSSNTDILVQLEIPLDTVATAVRLAAAHGTRVVLNPAPAQALPSTLLAGVSVLTPNAMEASVLTGLSLDEETGLEAVASALLARGLDAVLLTLGAAGLYVATADERVRMPAYEVSVVDTTGAGDAFNGALAVALAERKTVFEAARFAGTAAALSVTRRGAQPSAPHRTDILQRLTA